MINDKLKLIKQHDNEGNLQELLERVNDLGIRSDEERTY